MGALWDKINQADPAASELHKVDGDGRVHGILLLLACAIVTFFVFLPFFILVWQVNRGFKKDSKDKDTEKTAKSNPNPLDVV